jgi:hypothetical protein
VKIRVDLPISFWTTATPKNGNPCGNAGQPGRIEPSGCLATSHGATGGMPSPWNPLWLWTTNLPPSVPTRIGGLNELPPTGVIGHPSRSRMFCALLSCPRLMAAMVNTQNRRTSHACLVGVPGLLSGRGTMVKAFLAEPPIVGGCQERRLSVATLARLPS